MIDVSGFGTGIYVIGSINFPMGFQVTQFPDDEDPIQVDNIEVIGYEKLYDGTTFKFKKAAPVELSISVIAGSEDDMNLGILLMGNRSTAYNTQVPESSTMVFVFPDSEVVTLSAGSILSGPPVKSLTSQGRKKAQTYRFVFDQLASTGSIAAAGLSVLGGQLGSAFNRLANSPF